MNWRFLQQIVELVPGERAAATAVTNFPEDLLADHFPGIPVTPGVLLIEMCAQLGGKLVEISASERRGVLILPFLTMVNQAKLRRFVGPGEELRIETVLEALRGESAICAGTIHLGSERVATMSLMFAFEPDGRIDGLGLAAIEKFERAEFLRLGLDGFPPDKVTLQAVTGQA